MYSSILIAYNGTVESCSALLECIRLNPPASTKIHLLAVTHPQDSFVTGEYGASPVSSTKNQMALAKQKLEKAAAEGSKLLQDAELQVETHVETGEPADVISNMAERLGADLVIVGHHRHKSWVQSWWRGSTDAVLLEKLHCTLMISADFPLGK
ncbi:universal stress protein [Noviherbaspirillum humi]|uniref:universal stress protein n=1 Tax=Noviherbaspirillum humi TaxID=1688639 RepID=UPI000B77A04B|nr:universal stress protein [Noviherbaspirillum humi]